MNRPSPARVAIVGGGLSGLATAAQIHLADPEIQLTLFEAGTRVGGVIHSESDGPFLIDHGADMFATQPPAALNLIRQLGLEDRLIEPQPSRRGARIVHRGQLVPVPEGFVLMRATQWLPMMTTSLLSPLGKLRFLLERFVSPRSDDLDESVGEFVRRRMGNQVLDRIVAPLAAGIYTADINKLSMRATMAPIAEMERQYGSLAKAASQRRKTGEDTMERASAGARYEKFRAFRGGMKQFIDALAKSLPAETIQLNRSVERLEQSDGGWNVHVDGQSSAFDHVVVAVPPKPASRLLQPICPRAAEPLSTIEMASTAIVVLGVPRAQVSRDIDTFGFVVPLSERRRILAGSFASHKFAGRAPEDHVLIRVFIGGAMQPELLQLGDDELEKIAYEELQELIGLRGEPVLTRIVRWNDAMPQYHVGHLQRVEQIESAVSQLDRFSIVNNCLHGVGIAPLVGLAAKVAANVVAGFTDSGNSPSGDGVHAGTPS